MTNRRKILEYIRDWSMTQWIYINIVVASLGKTNDGDFYIHHAERLDDMVGKLCHRKTIRFQDTPVYTKLRGWTLLWPIYPQGHLSFSRVLWLVVRLLAFCCFELDFLKRVFISINCCKRRLQSFNRRITLKLPFPCHHFFYFLSYQRRVVKLDFLDFLVTFP